MMIKADYNSQPSGHLSPSQRVIREVAKAHDLRPEQITSRSRERFLMPARKEVARRLDAMGWSSVRIARAMNRSDHTTALYWLGRLKRNKRALSIDTKEAGQ